MGVTTGLISTVRGTTGASARIGHPEPNTTTRRSTLIRGAARLPLAACMVSSRSASSPCSSSVSKRVTAGHAQQARVAHLRRNGALGHLGCMQAGNGPKAMMPPGPWSIPRANARNNTSHAAALRGSASRTQSRCPCRQWRAGCRCCSPGPVPGPGVIGVVVPGLPSTVFILMAACRGPQLAAPVPVGSGTHPLFGSMLRNW